MPMWADHHVLDDLPEILGEAEVTVRYDEAPPRPELEVAEISGRPNQAPLAFLAKRRMLQSGSNHGESAVWPRCSSMPLAPSGNSLAVAMRCRIAGRSI